MSVEEKVVALMYRRLSTVDQQLTVLEGERLELLAAIKEYSPKRGYLRHEAYRDWVVRQRSSFCLADMAAAFGRDENSCAYHVKKMVARGSLVELPAEPGKERRWKYERPRDPGAAATLSAKAAGGKNGHRGEAAVAGTGRGQGVSHADTKQLLKEVAAQGAHYKLTGSGHYKITMGGKTLATIPSNPSDHRSIYNSRATLRRKGLKV